MRPVPAPFDIVITTNSGYPLDQNLYQAVKGMSAAAEVVTPGGTIICAAECRDGLPNHGSYGQLLPSKADRRPTCSSGSRRRRSRSRTSGRSRSRLGSRRKRDVFLRCDGLTDADVRAAHLEPIPDVGEAVERLLRDDPDARICVLPQGPQTIAYVA